MPWTTKMTVPFRRALLLGLAACSASEKAPGETGQDPDADDSGQPYIWDSQGQCVNWEPEPEPDLDSDGYTPSEGDCEPEDAAIHPGQAEVVGDGLDVNCDGLDRDVEPFSGLQLLPDYGYWAAGASLDVGDLDGDEWKDLVIGAPSAYSEALGQVFAMHGPIALDGPLTDGVVFTGEIPDDTYGQVGWSVVVLGDMDGDTLEDFAYGIPFGDGLSEYYAGRVFVIDGPADLGNEFELPSRVIYGSTQSAALGYGLNAPGDVDGDGLADLLVGASNLDYEAEEDAPGRTHLFLGPIGASWTEEDAALTLIGASDQDRAGEYLASDDFNGDGHPDFLVGGYWSAPRGNASGQGWLVYGPIYGTRLLADVAQATFLGEHEGDYAGSEVSSGGDLNEDGSAEILLGALLYHESAEREGRGYLLHGPVSGAIGLESADAMFTGLGAWDWTGARMIGAGDTDGDGLSEVLVSAPQQYEYSTGRFARVSLFEGPFSGEIQPESAARIFVSPFYADSLGMSLAVGPDLTGDGAPDLVAGAPYDDQGGYAGGRVTIRPVAAEP